MSRLIDADKEILTLKREIKECEAKIKLLEENKTGRSLYDVDSKIKDLKRNINDCKMEIRLLKRYDTAYKVEAVVRELEEVIKIHTEREKYCIEEELDFAAYSHSCEISALNKAIEIVKRGGRK